MKIKADFCIGLGLVVVLPVFIAPAVISVSHTASRVNQTHFDLYKNTGYDSCPPSIPPHPLSPSSLVYPKYPHLPRYVKPHEFCSYFWNYTVLPTTPRGVAFGPTLVSMVVNITSLVVTILLTARSMETVEWELGEGGDRSQENDSGERIGLLEDNLEHPTTTSSPAEWLEEGAETGFASMDGLDAQPRPPSPRPSRREYLLEGQGRQRPTMGWLFWSMLVYNIASLTLWFNSFSKLREESSSSSYISTTAWIPPLIYLLNLNRSPARGRNGLIVVFLPFVICFSVWISTIVMVATVKVNGPHYDITSTFEPSAFTNCTKDFIIASSHSLLIDPVNLDLARTFRILFALTSIFSFIFIVFALFDATSATRSHSGLLVVLGLVLMFQYQ